MIRRIWFIAWVVTLSCLSVSVPSTVFAQHGPDRHGRESGLIYDTKSEATFTGTVIEVKSGSSILSRLFRIHTLGVGHSRSRGETLTPGLRKLALTAHVTTSVGWLGAVAGFLALAIGAYGRRRQHQHRPASDVDSAPAPGWIRMLAFIVIGLILLFVILHLTGRGLGSLHQ
jgi:hypothetical protein